MTSPKLGPPVFPLPPSLQAARDELDARVEKHNGPIPDSEIPDNDPWTWTPVIEHNGPQRADVDELHIHEANYLWPLAAIAIAFLAAVTLIAIFNPAAFEMIQ